MLQIEIIPALKDNYVYLLRDPASGLVAVVDPAEAEPVQDRLAHHGWKLSYILNTHHHGDHTGGNMVLKLATGCHIVGARQDAARIPGIDTMLDEGDKFALGHETAMVIDTPGHTVGHIAFWFAESHALFCGDTLFALGCGRLFEGTPAQMWSSLQKLRTLPGTTKIYCGHEYTQSNAKFALSVDPENAALVARAAEIDAIRERGKPTIPALLSDEDATNPFLRADLAEMKRAIGMEEAAAVDVFAEIRKRKDSF